MDKWILRGPGGSVKRERAAAARVATPAPPALRRSERLKRDVICLTPLSAINSKPELIKEEGEGEFKRSKRKKQMGKNESPKSAKKKTKATPTATPTSLPAEAAAAATTTTPLGVPKVTINLTKREVVTTPLKEFDKEASEEEEEEQGQVRIDSQRGDESKDEGNDDDDNDESKVTIKSVRLPRFSFHKEPDEGEEDCFYSDNDSTDISAGNDCTPIESPTTRSREREETKENHSTSQLLLLNSSQSKNASSMAKYRFPRLADLGTGLGPGPFFPARRGHLDPKWLKALRPVERIIDIKPSHSGLTIVLLFEKSRFPSKVEHYHVWKFPNAANKLYDFITDSKLSGSKLFDQTSLTPFIQAVIDEVEISNNKSKGA